jgi:hypothetical protein
LAAAAKGRQKKKRESDAHLRQLAQKSTYVLCFKIKSCLPRFRAFLSKGISKMTSFFSPKKSMSKKLIRWVKWCISKPGPLCENAGDRQLVLGGVVSSQLGI